MSSAQRPPPARALTVYLWAWRRRLDGRFGQPCRLLVRGTMNSCLLEFEDGYRVVTSRNGIRRLPERADD